MTEEREQLRIVPIHRSLVRPQLLLGCDRVMFLMLCMVVTLLAGPGGLMTGSFFNMMMALALFFVGRALLSRLAKSDAQMSDVFRRSVLYQSKYSALGTVGFKNIPKAKRW